MQKQCSGSGGEPRFAYGYPEYDARGLWLAKSSVDPEVHQLRWPRAYSVDLLDLEALVETSGVGIRLYLIDGRILEVDVDVAQRVGRRINRGGCGEQLAIPLDYWRERGCELAGGLARTAARQPLPSVLPVSGLDSAQLRFDLE